MFCGVVSYCIVSCFVVLCRAVLCRVVLCCVVLCRAVLCCIVLCCVVLCCVVSCCGVLCCVVLCCVDYKELPNSTPVSECSAHVDYGHLLLVLLNSIIAFHFILLFALFYSILLM